MKTDIRINHRQMSFLQHVAVELEVLRVERKKGSRAAHSIFTTALPS